MIELIYLLFILSIASYYDIRYMKTPNYFWLISMIISIPFIIRDFIQQNIYYTYLWCFSLALVILMSYFLFSYTEFGGSDAKSLIFISILAPIMVFLVSLLACLFAFFFLLIRHKKTVIPFIPFLLVSFLILQI